MFRKWWCFSVHDCAIVQYIKAYLFRIFIWLHSCDCSIGKKIVALCLDCDTFNGSAALNILDDDHSRLQSTTSSSSSSCPPSSATRSPMYSTCLSARRSQNSPITRSQIPTCLATPTMLNVGEVHFSIFLSLSQLLLLLILLLLLLVVVVVVSLLLF